MASAITRRVPAVAVPAFRQAILRTSLGHNPTALGFLRSFSSEVGTIPGTTVKIVPIRRTGEDDKIMRARLLYQSRKRGTLESDLLMSTFAHAHLDTMTRAQMEAYDLFLDENDWDIYYWATQKAPDATEAAAAVAGVEADTPPRPSGFARPEGEWADTVGAFKPVYRPVPARWEESEILTMLREHVQKSRTGGMAFMPALK